jgi:hypothetical protein
MINKVWVVINYDLNGDVKIDKVFDSVEKATVYIDEYAEMVNSYNIMGGTVHRFKKEANAYYMQGCGGIRIEEKVVE